MSNNYNTQLQQNKYTDQQSNILNEIAANNQILQQTEKMMNFPGTAIGGSTPTINTQNKSSSNNNYNQSNTIIPQQHIQRQQSHRQSPQMQPQIQQPMQPQIQQPMQQPMQQPIQQPMQQQIQQPMQQQIQQPMQQQIQQPMQQQIHQPMQQQIQQPMQQQIQQPMQQPMQQSMNQSYANINSGLQKIMSGEPMNQIDDQNLDGGFELSESMSDIHYTHEDTNPNFKEKHFNEISRVIDPIVENNLGNNKIPARRINRQMQPMKKNDNINKVLAPQNIPLDPPEQNYTTEYIIIPIILMIIFLILVHPTTSVYLEKYIPPMINLKGYAIRILIFGILYMAIRFGTNFMCK